MGLGATLDSHHGLLDPERRREVGYRIEDEIGLQVRVVEVGCTKLTGPDEHPSHPGCLRALDVGTDIVTDHDEIGRREAQGPRRGPKNCALGLPATTAVTPAAYSIAATNGPASRHSAPARFQ